MEQEAFADTSWRKEAIGLCRQAIEMLRCARTALATQQLEPIERAEHLSRTLHRDERSLTERLVHPLPSSRVVLESDRQRLFVPVHLDRIASNIDQLLAIIRTVHGLPVTDRARFEISTLIDAAADLLQDVHDLVLTENRALRQHVIQAGRALVSHADDYAAFHEQRLIEGVCAPKASSLYLGAIEAIKGVEWHSREIAQKLGRLTAEDVENLEAAIDAAEASDLARRTPEAPASRPSPIGWVP